MLRIHNVKLPLSYTKKNLTAAACRRLGVTAAQVASCAIAKKSVDARKKSDVCFVVSLDVSLRSPQDERRVAARLSPAEGGLAAPYAPPVLPALSAAPSPRPVVVGLGPAGLFAA